MTQRGGSVYPLTRSWCFYWGMCMPHLHAHAGRQAHMLAHAHIRHAGSRVSQSLATYMQVYSLWRVLTFFHRLFRAVSFVLDRNHESWSNSVLLFPVGPFVDFFGGVCGWLLRGGTLYSPTYLAPSCPPTARQASVVNKGVQDSPLCKFNANKLYMNTVIKCNQNTGNCVLVSFIQDSRTVLGH